MMRSFVWIYFMTAAVFFAGCSNDDDAPSICPECRNAPEAKPQFDNSGRGIYKGFVVGPSGNVVFNIGNDNLDSIYAVLTIDGRNIRLRTTATFNSGTGFDGVFRGTKNNPNDVEIALRVSANGSEYSIVGVPVIPGYPSVTIVIEKELSTALVKVFEGTMDGSITGTFNLLTRGNQWKAVARPADGTANEEGKFHGSVSGNSLACDCPEFIEFSGTISGSGEVINGTWAVNRGGDPEFSGTWTVRRTR